MQARSIAECPNGNILHYYFDPLEHSAIVLTLIKLPFVIKTFVLSSFEWPFYTGFTVCDIRTYCIRVMSYFMRLLYLSHKQAVKAQTSLHSCSVLPELSLAASTCVDPGG